MTAVVASIEIPAGMLTDENLTEEIARAKERLRDLYDERRRRAVEDRNDARRKAGRCIRCGKPRDAARSKSRCARCLELAARD